MLVDTQDDYAVAEEDESIVVGAAGQCKRFSAATTKES